MEQQLMLQSAKPELLESDSSDDPEPHTNSKRNLQRFVVGFTSLTMVAGTALIIHLASQPGMVESAHENQVSNLNNLNEKEMANVPKAMKKLKAEYEDQYADEAADAVDQFGTQTVDSATNALSDAKKVATTYGASDDLQNTVTSGGKGAAVQAYSDPMGVERNIEDFAYNYTDSKNVSKGVLDGAAGTVADVTSKSYKAFEDKGETLIDSAIDYGKDEHFTEDSAIDTEKYVEDSVEGLSVEGAEDHAHAVATTAAGLAAGNGADVAIAGGASKYAGQASSVASDIGGVLR